MGRLVGQAKPACANTAREHGRAGQPGERTAAGPPAAVIWVKRGFCLRKGGGSAGWLEVWRAFTVLNPSDPPSGCKRPPKRTRNARRETSEPPGSPPRPFTGQPESKLSLVKPRLVRALTCSQPQQRGERNGQGSLPNAKTLSRHKSYPNSSDKWLPWSVLGCMNMKESVKKMSVASTHAPVTRKQTFVGGGVPLSKEILHDEPRRLLTVYLRRLVSAALTSAAGNEGQCVRPHVKQTRNRWHTTPGS